MNDKFQNIFSLAGRDVLVTGASSGLGRHFALTLAAGGARTVFIAARKAEKLAGLKAEIEEIGAVSHALQLDVTDVASVKSAFDVIASLGVTADVIVNNAGVTETKPFLEQSVEDWNKVIDTNLRGCWFVSQEGAKRLVFVGQKGSVINIASILGERVASHIGPYCISKAGIVQATKVAALELARYDIRVNALLPGYIVTDLNRDFLMSEAGERLRSRIPSRRFGYPENLDGPLLLLASAAGAHITGATLSVDGGHLVSSL